MKKQITLAREEWSFALQDECPENQIEFCYLYEFAREAWRAGFGGEKDPLYRSHPFMRHFPQWRTLPYLGVPLKHREKAIATYHKEIADYKEFVRSQPTGPTPGPVAPVDELRDQRGYQDTVTKDCGDFPIRTPSTNTFGLPTGRGHTPVGLTTWFVHQIEWERDDKYLVEEFAQWLIDQRPPDAKAHVYDTRRDTTTREKLTRLAVLRLHHAYGYKKAKDATQNWSPYGAHESWCRAARQAKTDLEEFIYENCEIDTDRFTSKKLTELDVEKVVAEYLRNCR